MKTDKPIEPVYQAIGARIAMIRNMLGITQDDLCKRVNLARASIANIENGKQRILLDDVELFAQALGTSPKRRILRPKIKLRPIKTGIS